MVMQMFDRTVQRLLDERLRRLEKHFDADVVFLYAPLTPFLEKHYRDLLEDLCKPKRVHARLVIILNSPGGIAETVEKLVEITRKHYDEVYFVVPDYAMSAGTIFCMSGEKIYMDYSSSLGPIDPQVDNGQTLVPALGYLDKVEELIEKARKNTLTAAEFAILQNQDLATLKAYEQAKELTIDLLKKWLVAYKFKTWTQHRTDQNKLGQPVTLLEKENRATEIANILSSNKQWHSHNRYISSETLRGEVRLEIDDYSGDKKLQPLIRSYNDIITEYIRRGEMRVFLHSRKFF